MDGVLLLNFTTQSQSMKDSWWTEKNATCTCYSLHVLVLFELDIKTLSSHANQSSKMKNNVFWNILLLSRLFTSSESNNETQIQEGRVKEEAIHDCL